MAEKTLPISKTQHDAVAAIMEQIKTLNDRLSIVASTIIAGTDEDIPKAGVEGVRVTAGVYQLVLSVPE